MQTGLNGINQGVCVSSVERRDAQAFDPSLQKAVEIVRRSTALTNPAAIDSFRMMELVCGPHQKHKRAHGVQHLQHFYIRLRRAIVVNSQHDGVEQDARRNEVGEPIALHHIVHVLSNACQLARLLLLRPRLLQLLHAPPSG
jgi:hypothetical protein